MKYKTLNLIILISFAITTIVIWQIPGGRLILYPFTLLGTWFHEMGHGIAGMILGGNFKTLEINYDGSGLAYITGEIYFGNIGQAIIAAAGAFGPVITGASFIALSRKADISKFILMILSIIILISVVLWLRSWIAILVISAIALIIIFIALNSNEKIKSFTVQFLGFQSCISAYISLDNLFSNYIIINEVSQLSDTAIIEKYLFLPYWFWGLIIIITSIILIFKSLKNTYF
jgi:hypothetical protein